MAMTLTMATTVTVTLNASERDMTATMTMTMILSDSGLLSVGFFSGSRDEVSTIGATLSGDFWAGFPTKNDSSAD